MLDVNMKLGHVVGRFGIWCLCAPPSWLRRRRVVDAGWPLGSSVRLWIVDFSLLRRGVGFSGKRRCQQSLLFSESVENPLLRDMTRRGAKKAERWDL